MKVAFFTNNYLPRISGVANSVEFLRKSLEELGIEVFVFAPSYEINDYPSSQERIIRIRSLRFWWLKRFAFPLPFFNIQKINRVLSRIQPDIIHFHQPFLLGRLALKWAIKSRVPVVFTYHSLYEEYVHYFPFHQKICKKMASYYTVDSANKSNLIICPTEQVADYLRAKGVSNRIVVVPTGIDFNCYGQRFTEKQLREFKQTLGITTDNKILLYVGRMVKEKNIQFLLRAAEKILKQRKDMILIMVGDGTLLSSYCRFAQKMRIDKQIIWTGSQPPEKLPWFYQIADLFLFPSKTDTQAIVLYEALASGLPVIAVASLASKAIVKNGDNGFLSSDDLGEFSRAVINNLSFKQKKPIFLEQKKYTPSGIALFVYQLYQKVISEYSFAKKYHSVSYKTNESV